MVSEDVFSVFKNVRRGYFKIQEVFNKQSFTPRDLLIIKKAYKRIKINNSITTILNCIERISLSELSQAEINELKKCFLHNNIDINEFRNCLAHAHYEVDKDFKEIKFKKGDFELDLKDFELENVAKEIFYVIGEKIKPQTIPFDGIRLNNFLDDLISGADIINADATMYATLIQSYNIYHAFLYEKVVQQKEQKKYSEYYENNTIINLNLPYINQQVKTNPQNISFDSLMFEDLTELSKADLIYFMLTSEYSGEFIKYLKQNFENITDEEIVKKIASMYLYQVDDYKDIVCSVFEKNDINKNENLDDTIKRFIKENVCESDYDKCNQIIEFMMMKFPKIGRIYQGNIMPSSKELLYGFTKQDNYSTFIYPNFEKLTKVGTRQEFFEEFIHSNAEIKSAFNAVEVSENAIIKPAEFMIYLSSIENLKEDERINFTDNVDRILNKMGQTENIKEANILFSNVKKGKEGKETKDEVENFLANIPKEYKELFVANKLLEIDIKEKPTVAYRYILFLLKEFGLKKIYMEHKRKVESLIKKKEIGNTDYDRVKKMLELGELFDKLESLEREDIGEEYRDFTKLIEHIRDASVHAYSDVDFSNLNKEKFTIKKKPINMDERVNLTKLLFNFQDYDSAKGETTFLLMDIPVETVMAIIDMPSDYLIGRDKSEKGDNEETKFERDKKNDKKPKSRDDDER